MRALVEVVGIDHVCIGTDTKLTPPYRPPAGPAPQGGGAPGNRPEGPPPGDKSPGVPGGGQPGRRVGERTNEAWPNQQVRFYYAVVEVLLQTGFTATEIGKFGGGNFCRVFEAATAGHR